MKNEMKLLQHNLQNTLNPLVEKARRLTRVEMPADERLKQAKAVLRQGEDVVLQVKKPLYELEEELDKLRACAELLSERKERLARMAS